MRVLGGRNLFDAGLVGDVLEPLGVTDFESTLTHNLQQEPTRLDNAPVDHASEAYRFSTQVVQQL